MENDSSRVANDTSRETNRLAFFVGFLRYPQQVGSIIPSSRFLEQRILDAARLQEARLVVELGPGTGGTTRTFLRHLSPGAKLLTIELNSEFTDLLDQIDDERLINHHGSAECLATILADHKLGAPDVVISGIPFSTIPKPVGQDIIKSVRTSLAPNGRFVAYQFRNEVANIARPIMGEPDSVLEMRNVPPMRVYRWQKPALNDNAAA